ncbi:MAG: Gfo/Idh/MocA family oxidoreductase [Verrucomicrobia bacterium]|nr:Gfo/Idh/MocA family oxidoreductase [Verrucomicrobiota bacterium]
MPQPNSPIILTSGLNRRRFIYTSAFGLSAAALRAHAAGKPRIVSPNSKVNLAAIAAGGKGGTDIAGLHDGGANNVVALCDVDKNTLDAALQKYPGAKVYQDYRVMLEKEKNIDAVNVSTPDHHHYPATMLAMQRGIATYTQKPLTHTIWEARQLSIAAKKLGVITQMGNQGHSGDGNRTLCEHIWSGTIGDVKEVHCWTNRPIWPQGITRPVGNDPVPDSLNWDIWIGPAPMRPYVGPKDEEVADKAGKKKKKAGRGPYHPFSWRGIWDFGAGALGDMGCHVMDGACWALNLSNPVSVEVVESSPLNNESAPEWAVLRYEFPERAGHDGKLLPACTLYWHDGKKTPPRPEEMEAAKFAESGTLFIGSKGKMLTDTYGERPRLLPESKSKELPQPPQMIERVPGNNPYKDFIRGVQGGPKPCSNFEVAGPFTEVVLLGNLALRVGKKVMWDAKNMKSPNCPEAAKLVKKDYRKGWKV